MTITVGHKPDDVARAELLRAKAAALLSIKRQLDIPSYHEYGTMIRGVPSISNDGISITVGHEWESESSNKAYLRRLQRKGETGVYIWRHPTVIKVRGRYSEWKTTPATQRRMEDWMLTLAQAAESIGLKIRDLQSTYMELAL